MLCTASGYLSGSADLWGTRATSFSFQLMFVEHLLRADVITGTVDRKMTYNKTSVYGIGFLVYFPYRQIGR